MAAATKEKRFQWNKGDTRENLIIVSLISKLRWNIYNINLNADKVKQREAVREAMNSGAWTYIFFFCKYVFLPERYAAKDRFRFSSIILKAVIIPKSWKLSAVKRLNRERSHAPILAIRVLGAISRATAYLTLRLITQPGLKLVM